jgi:tetratricopeptide (TPR) repeat protein
VTSSRGRYPNAAPRGTDLVAEIHSEHDYQVEALAQQRRARRNKRIIWAVTMTVLFAIIVVVGKIGWDAQRHSRALEQAREHLDKATPGDFTAAVAEIEKALSIVAADAEAQSVLALIRAHEAIATGQLEALDAAIEPVADADEPEAKLAKGVAAAIRGDLEATQAMVDATADVDGLANRRTRAWLQGTVALAHPYDDDRVAAAIESLQGVVDDDPWSQSHRWLAALLARAGRSEDALAQLTKAREVAPGDLGIAADEALLHAWEASHEQGVLEVCARILEDGTLTSRSRARAQLAIAIVRARKGDEDAAEARDRAWKQTPSWDADTRDLTIMAAFLAHDLDTGEKWLKKTDPSETVQDIYGAWKDLLTGDTDKALERSAALPQSRPKVALVQALALTEQERWAEAGPWIDRGIEYLGNLPELRVAQQRVAAHTGDPKPAIEALDELADDYPATWRVFTGLGQAHLATWKDRDKEDPPSGAEKALDKAVDKEAIPAEAAYLLGVVAEHEARKKPKRAEKALEMYGRAMELREADPRYRTTYGTYLASHGDPKKAREVLAELLDSDTPVGDPIVTYARLRIAAAEGGGKKVTNEDFDKWVAKAAQGGADPGGIVRARAALALATTSGPLAQPVVTELAGRLTQDPKDIEARVLHSRALLRLRDFDTARASLKYGMKQAETDADGRLYIAQAAVEAADKGERLAASLAQKGWRKIEAEPRPPNELIEYAWEAADFWEEVDNSDVPRSIGVGLTKRVPYRAEAWGFRAVMEFRDGRGDDGCKSASKAMKISEDVAAAQAAQGECYISKHQYPEARKAYDKAIKLAESDREQRQYKRRRRAIR